MEQETDADFWLNVTSWLRMDEEKWQAMISGIAERQSMPPEKVEEILDLYHQVLAEAKQAN